MIADKYLSRKLLLKIGYRCALYRTRMNILELSSMSASDIIVHLPQRFLWLAIVPLQPTAQPAVSGADRLLLTRRRAHDTASL